MPSPRTSTQYYLKKVSRTQQIAEDTLGGAPTHSFMQISDSRVIKLRKLAQKLARNDKRPKEKKYGLWNALDAGRALYNYFIDVESHSTTYAREIQQKKKRPKAPNGEVYAAVSVFEVNIVIIVCRVQGFSIPRSSFFKLIKVARAVSRYTRSPLPWTIPDR